MRLSDKIKMCFDSLRRRKGRTILTVLGVFIGVTSIVVMVSIGVGMSESYDQMIKNMGDVNAIEVYSWSSDNKLNDEALKTFSEIENVESVLGKASLNDYSTNCFAGQNDRYQSYWASICGSDFSALENAGYELLEGRMAKADDEIVVGQYFAYNFYDTQMPEGHNYVDRYRWDEETGEMLDPDPAFFNPINMTLKIKYMSYEQDEKTVTKEYRIVGIFKEDGSKGWETSEGVFMTTNAIKAVIADMTNMPVVTVKLNYNTIIVHADNIKTVSTVEDAIKNLGYNTSSMQSIREELEKETRQIELLLGGLGAISLLVAAIGITNTMTMSIAERTKEIGIMKALGCYIKDIRQLFLMEAGTIGLIGGIIGLLFSFIVSIVLNIFSFGRGVSWEVIKMAIFGSEDMTRLSVISIPLMIFAIIFSTAVGVVSGYQPANKAVKISALEAIRNE